ncbi:MAG: hypothetical protein EPN88_07600 [Bacteroidetes bacterium]|nr:MAG: hypothetical protein EPN88_07600 [Bacteroidota bacterium]
MSIKLLSISSTYSGYLESFYKKHTDTSLLTYNQHYSLLINETTEFAGAYTRNFRKLGIDATCVIANDTVLQNKWKSENNKTLKENSDILFAQIESFKPDILWIENLNYTDNSWFLKVRKVLISIKHIIAYHCAPYNKLTLDKLKNADFVITCTPGLKITLENEGIKTFLVYHGFDSDLLTRIETNRKEPVRNLVFSGSLVTGGSFHNSRIELIEKIILQNVGLSLYVTLENKYKIIAKQILYSLSELSKKMGMEKLTDKIPVFEYGRSRVKGYSDYLLKSNNTPLYGIDMYNLFNTSKIVLNIHIGVAGDYAGNMRLFEVTGMGSCLLTDNKKNMSELFDVDKEVVVYDSPEDCIRKIKWLLENDEERIKIARAGQKKTLESHTVEARCKNIINIINNQNNLS